MTVVYDDLGHVSHGVLAVETDQEGNYVDLDDAYTNCVSGLVGASAPGYLAFEAGLQSGYLGLKVEVLDSEPAVDLEWEEIIEVSFTPSSDTLTWADFEGNTSLEMTLEPQCYRVRYYGKGIDAAQEEGFVMDDDIEPPSSILVQFWPAPPAPEVILKVTSDMGEIGRKGWAERR